LSAIGKKYKDMGHFVVELELLCHKFVNARYAVCDC